MIWTLRMLTLTLCLNGLSPNDPGERLKQPSLGRDDMRYHVEVHASHREQMWEAPSASLIERDPEVISDVDIAANLPNDQGFFP